MNVRVLHRPVNLEFLDDEGAHQLVTEEAGDD